MEEPLNDLEAEREFDYRAEQVIKNQRFSRRPKRTSDLISKVIARRGFAETRRNEQLEQVWIDIVGQELARKTKLGSIRKGVLQVFLTCTNAKQHFSMIKDSLVEDLKHNYKGIEDIRFKIGN